MKYGNGILSDVERPLFPNESYLIKKYGNSEGIQQTLILGSNASKSIHEMSVIKEEMGGDRMSKISGRSSMKS